MCEAPPQVDGEEFAELDPGYISVFDLFSATFRRGFPECLTFSPLTADRFCLSVVLPQWSRIAPLAELVVRGWVEDRGQVWMPRGSFLQKVNALTFENYDAADARARHSRRHTSPASSG